MKNKKSKLRKANLRDAKNIQKLIMVFANRELMLPRSLNQIYENIRDFWIVEVEDNLVACGALHPVWGDMAEIKSLAVNEDFHKRGYGKIIVEACISECETLGVDKVFALTFVPEFFEKMSFVREDKNKMPHKIWTECINCPHFPDCNEILVVKDLK
ncbi:MAG: N-acetyltransferase [Elusimicrobia bacterium]|nr:N-acetyltransferase [Elusimicrobiota bacterium]